MEDDKKEVIVDANYWDQKIIETNEKIDKETDPKKIEAYSKLIDSYAKAKQACENAEFDGALKIETIEQKNEEIKVQKEKIASDDKRSWLTFAGGVLAFLGSIAAPVLNGLNAKDYLITYKKIENDGTLMNTSRSMIPNIFTRNK